MITKINHRLETNIVNTFHDVTYASVEACKPVQHHKSLNKQDYKADPVLVLQILFERLVLFPIASSTPSAQGTRQSNKKQNQHSISVNRTINERLRLFKQGRIRELYEEGNNVVSKTPREMASNPDRLQKSAQHAIDLDNVKSGNV
eukprot:scaffold211404_cov36-Cyclotella_meneghiniana.AAC.2